MPRYPEYTIPQSAFGVDSTELYGSDRDGRISDEDIKNMHRRGTFKPDVNGKPQRCEFATDDVYDSMADAVEAAEAFRMMHTGTIKVNIEPTLNNNRYRLVFEAKNS
jgi:hypothetical protein